MDQISAILAEVWMSRAAVFRHTLTIPPISSAGCGRSYRGCCGWRRDGRVYVVVVVVVCWSSGDGISLVAVVDELQEAKAIDATRRKLSSAQIIPFFIYTPPFVHYIPFYTF